MNKFKEVLKELRYFKRVTQPVVAKYLGVTTSCYSSYEQGRTEPDLDTLILLAKYYEVSVDTLLGIED